MIPVKEVVSRAYHVFPDNVLQVQHFSLSGKHSGPLPGFKGSEG